MTALSPREELIRIQKQIFRKNQKIIDESILVSERGFAKYEKNYLKHVRNFRSVAKVEDLKKSMEDAEWIYLGDYHTNRQSQRALLRLLKMLVVQSERFVICLEFLQKRHQGHVEKFLQGKLSLNAFLQRINLRKHFYFDLWENFEPIFDFAKYYGLDVYGIESAPFGSGLKKRDEAMAKSLAEIDAQHPGFKKFIFVGDLHIAPENLPRQVKAAAGKGYDPRTELFIYQNSEKIYWRLAENHLEDKIEIVRLDEKSFCLINTPPIVWQQSYLNWLENDEGEIDYQDPKHSFLDLSERIAKFLGLKLPKSKDEVEVFTCGDLSFLERLKEDPDFTPREKRTIRHQIEMSESYYIPKHKWVYLANVSMNHAAEEASHFIRHLVAGDEFPRDPEDAFYANALHEAMGFFGSKIINQKRKCARVEDFESLIEHFKKVRAPRNRTFDIEVAHTVLEAKRWERKGVPAPHLDVLGKRHELFFAVTHALGYMLGELLYHAMVQGKFAKREILCLFRDPFREGGDPFQAYSRLLKKFKSTPLPQRI